MGSSKASACLSPLVAITSPTHSSVHQKAEKLRFSVWVLWCLVLSRMTFNFFLMGKVYHSIWYDSGLRFSEPSLSSTANVGFCPYPSIGKDGKANLFLGLLPGWEGQAVSSRVTQAGKCSGPSIGSSGETEPRLPSSRPPDPLCEVQRPTFMSQEKQELRNQPCTWPALAVQHHTTSLLVLLLL